MTSAPISNSAKLFIAVPVYGDVPLPFLMQMMKLAIGRLPFEFSIDFTQDSLVTRARNTLTAKFLSTDCTHLLFIDSDLIFSVEQIARIASHPEDVVGGFYPKKQEGPIGWVMNGCLEPKETRPDGLVEVRYVGTGFLRIARSVFENMMQAHWDIVYKPDHADRLERDYWPVGPYRYKDGTVRYLSEDWYFCQRWLDLGGKVWADTQIILKHCGRAIYPLSYQEAEIRTCSALSVPSVAAPSGSAPQPSAINPQPLSGPGIQKIHQPVSPAPVLSPPPAGASAFDLKSQISDLKCT
jgi:hypothetical protein